MAVTWLASATYPYNLVGTLSNGNLTLTEASSLGTYIGFAEGTTSYSTGKYYFEVRLQTGSTKRVIAVGLISPATQADHYLTGHLGNSSGAYKYQWSLEAASPNLLTFHNGSNTNYGSYTRADNDVIGVAIDFDAKKLWFAYNNVWVGSGDPASGTNPTWSGTDLSTPTSLYPAVTSAASGVVTAAFLASDFTYSAPSGFSAWDSGSVDVTQPLTGLSATSARGTLVGNYWYGALIGQSAASNKGTLTPGVSVQLTGRVAASAYGVVIGGPLVTGLQLASAFGVLTPQATSVTQPLTGISGFVVKGQIGAVVSQSVALTGLSVSGTFGVIIPGISPSLTGQVTYLSEGNVATPNAYATLTGQGSATAYGTLSANIAVVPVGQQATVLEHLGAVVSGGNANVFLAGQTLAVLKGGLTPGVTVGTSTTSLRTVPIVTSAYANANADPYRSYTAWAHNKSLMSFQGQLQGVGELWGAGVGGTGVAMAMARVAYAIDQTERLLGNDWSSTRTESWDYQNHGDNMFSTYQFGSNLTGPWYLNGGPPYTNQFNNAAQLGGHYSIGLDGSIHWIYERYFYNPTGPVYNYYIPYQNSVRNFTLQDVAVATPNSSALGVYAHNANNAYVFYQRVGGGVAYQRWNGTVFGTEVGLATWTGSTANTPADRYLTAVRAGYGDTVYLVYRATGDLVGSSTAYIGVVVFDAVTETVTSHVLTNLTSTLTTTFAGNTPNAQVAAGHRPLAEVAVLSNGTSVTQFILWGAVVNLSWTSSTATTPTITVKTPPASIYDGYAPGWESLEIRGDVAMHILYGIDFRSSDQQTAVYGVKNDATGTGSSWSSPVELFHFGDVSTPMPGSAFNAANMWLSGYGGNGPTYLFYQPMNQSNAAPGSTTGKAWVDWWGGVSVVAMGRVGSVTITIQPGAVAPLTGQSLSSAVGVLVPQVTGAGALVGQAVAVQQGAIIGSGIVDVTRGLTGLGATMTRGALGLGVLLNGQVAATQQGSPTSALARQLGGNSAVIVGGTVFPVLSVVPVGETLSVGEGVLGVVLTSALSGNSAVVQEGTLAPTLTVGLNGRFLLSGYGSVAPGLSIKPTGIAAAIAEGALAVRLARALTGQQAVMTVGVFTPHADVNLFAAGVSAKGQIGEFPTTTNVPSVPPDLDLWAQSEIEKMFVVVMPDEENRLNDDTPLYANSPDDDLFN
jgi:hypothetical protein